MSLSFDVWLILGIAGFYLYDSAMLLYVDEIVLGNSSEKWFADCPISQWMIRGRVPYVPNPLTPGNPLFRVALPTEVLPLDSFAVEETNRLITSIRLTSYLATSLLAILMVGVPFVILRLGTGTWFFAIVALTYINIVVMLVSLFTNREQIGLSRNAYIGLAFDAVVCPPFAINLVRKVTLRRGISFDPIALAFMALEPDRFRELAQAIRVRLDMEMEREDEDSPRTTVIKTLQDQLTAMAA